MICIICESLIARSTPSRNCKLQKTTRLHSVFIFYLTTCYGWSFLSVCYFPHCSYPSIDCRGILFWTFEQMWRNVCKAKCYNMLGCRDNLWETLWLTSLGGHDLIHRAFWPGMQSSEVWWKRKVWHSCRFPVILRNASLDIGCMVSGKPMCKFLYIRWYCNLGVKLIWTKLGYYSYA